MADETPRPKRKRRRWIVAGVLLLAYTAWWYWPRGDAKFVGKWTLSEVNDGVETVAGWIELRPNGSVSSQIYQPTDFWPTSWRIQDEQLFINDPFADHPEWFRRLATDVRQAFSKSAQPIGGRIILRVVDVGSEVIRLEFGRTGDFALLRRIPE